MNPSLYREGFFIENLYYIRRKIVTFFVKTLFNKSDILEHSAMKEKCLEGLKRSDFELLLKTPEKDLLGEIIRLNCTIYRNTLDVIKVSTHIRIWKTRAA